MATYITFQGMPGKNTIKSYIANHYYHIYNRGWNRTAIFQDDADYTHFESLVARCLSPIPIRDPKGRESKRLNDEVDLNSYCFIPNNFHMLVSQHIVTQYEQFVLDYEQEQRANDATRNSSLRTILYNDFRIPRTGLGNTAV